MAKAKKSESNSAGTAKKKATKTKSAEPAGQPLVDTNLAAQAAARRVVAGLAPASTTGNAPMTQSTSFKNFKDSLSKPATNAMASMLDKTAGAGQKKTNTPFHGGKQLGRNQTFGADVNRTGVPRRTGGG